MTAWNPILPLDEYIPDGEPHVFGDRIYLFGSHDTEGGDRYCAEQNYMGWSAPLSDPTNWICHGEIYSSKQDPAYDEHTTNDLYAPDVVQGNDGRYYLYYGIETSGEGANGHNSCRVAVCDTPAGRYEFYGVVQNPDGTPHHMYLMGDPAVINDDGQIRLYCGWSLSMVAAGAHKQGKGFSGEKNSSQSQSAQRMPEPGSPAMKYALASVYQMLFHRSPEETKDLRFPLMGANHIALEDDMITVKTEPMRVVNGQFDTPKDSSFYGHAFYEASSIRKINGTYYFIYSSENSNELCYATSQYPDRDFVYGGTIISNGDVGYQGIKNEDRLNMTANDHGSLECINGQWFIFHHRQTHASTFSRQACVERVTIEDDGSIAQVECTSLGFHEGPLPAEGTYPAVISCILTNGHMPHCTNTKLEERIPNITHAGSERFITNIEDSTRIGYKYFAFDGKTDLELVYRGPGEGELEIVVSGIDVSKIKIVPSEDWCKVTTSFEHDGTQELDFVYHGKDTIDLKEFSFLK